MAAIVKDSSIAIALFEHDTSGDDLCVWTYPSVSMALQTACANRISNEGQQSSSFYFKLKNDWVYVITLPVSKDVIPEVTSASICVVARVFNPEKYALLGKILFEQYKSSGDPTRILEGYLSIHTVGSFANGAGTIDANSLREPDSGLSVCVIKDLYEMLGVEFIVLWNAILLKKRVLVVAENVDNLLSVMRTLPQFAWHRKDFTILRPIVRAEPEHLDDLTTSGVFAAGTLDPSLASRSEIYDVLLSIPERRVTVTNHALADMKMCAVHRELAAICQETIEAGSDLDLLKCIAKKTSSVLTQLKTLAAGGKLTEDVINENVPQVAAQQWLVRLAAAEGMM